MVRLNGGDKVPSYLNKFNKLDEQTKVFEVEVELKRMYEIPDQALEVKSEDTVEHKSTTNSVKSEGTPEGDGDAAQVKAVPRETQNKETVMKTKSIQHHQFYQDEEGNLFLWGGDPYGTFRIDARNAIKAMGRRGYHLNTVLDLLQIKPQWLAVTGGARVDGTDTVLEKRVMKFGREFRVPVKYDYVGQGLMPNSPHNGERKVKFYILISPECPAKTTEILALVHAMQGLHGKGPTKRGDYKVTDIKTIKWEEYQEIAKNFKFN